MPAILPSVATSQPLIWDYTLTQAQLRTALLGQNGDLGQPTAFDQSWLLSRLLQHHSFYDVIKIVPFAVLQKQWAVVKPTLMSKSLQDAYEYYINKVVSASR